VPALVGRRCRRNNFPAAVICKGLGEPAGKQASQAPSGALGAQITLPLDGELHRYVVVGDHEITLARPDRRPKTFRLS
jgi:hypothetical protein